MIVNTFSDYELNVLNSYNFLLYNSYNNSRILCIKNGRLDALDRKDLTCWNLFKSIFGCGKLKGVKAYRISEIGSYIAKRDIKQVDQSSNAYKNILIIANKCLTPDRSAREVYHPLTRATMLVYLTSHGRYLMNAETTLRDIYNQSYQGVQFYRLDDNKAEQFPSLDSKVNVDVINGLCCSGKWGWGAMQPSASHLGLRHNLQY